MNARTVLATLICGTTACISLAAEPVFIERDGMVVIEAESAPPAGGWKRETNLTGFTGSCYYTDSGGGGILRYRILITNPGRYDFRIRNRHDFHDSTLQNDCWTKMDSGPRVKTYSHRRGEWTWATNHEFSHNSKPPAAYDLTAGEHVLEVSGRSSGFSIDRFHLFREDVPRKKAEDSSLAESRSGPSLPELTRLPRVKAYVDQGAPGMALAMAQRSRDPGDPEQDAEARQAEEALLSYASQRLDEITRVKDIAPVEAVSLLASLAQEFSGSDRGRELMALAREWNGEPAVRNAMQAERIFTQIERMARPMRGKGRATDQKFARRYRQQISSIAQYTSYLQKKFPDTPGCRKAVSLSRELAIPVRD